MTFDGSASALTGAQTGQGLAVDAATGAHTQLQVIDSDFSHWNKNAIDIVNGNGSAGGGTIVVDIKGGTFTTVATDVLAQNGILFWNRGASVSGTVDGVTLAGLDYIGTANTEATGIISYGTANLTAIRNTDFGSIQQFVACESTNSIDARQNNTFDGVLGASASASELAAIEGRIWDREDDPSLGKVVLQ